MRKVGESLHGESFDDAAFVLEVVEENCGGVGAFFWGELQARKYLGYVPADFLLWDGGDLAEKDPLVRLQELRIKS